MRAAIYDDAPKIAVWLTMPFFATALDGAHTLLWAGCSEDITIQDGGRYVIPFGKWHPNPRRDLLDAISENEPGPSYAKGLDPNAENHRQTQVPVLLIRLNGCRQRQQDHVRSQCFHQVAVVLWE